MTQAEPTHVSQALASAAHVGRADDRHGCLTPDRAAMMAAAVTHETSQAADTAAGAPLPPLWHWAAFPEHVPLSDLGPDGHARLGKFLPDLGFARRMWAGGRVAFHGTLHIGEALQRRSTITKLTPKTGATGDMVFVTVRHRIEGERGATIEEDQDLVYLPIPESYSPPRRVPAPDAPDFDEPVAIDTVRLFRFSAATANGHRIHYDLDYARQVEKYPALVTHGPLQAILLADSASRHAGRPPDRFGFRGVHPMFHTHDLRLQGKRLQGGVMDLGTVAPEGYLGMTARAEWD